MPEPHRLGVREGGRPEARVSRLSTQVRKWGPVLPPTL